MPEPRSFPGRRFRVWEYSVGHRQLLLRSTKDGDHSTRVEIAFKDVRAIQIPTVVDELSIAVANAAAGADARARLGDDSTTGIVYGLSGLAFQGYVIAGIAFGHEDDGDYWDPSPLLSSNWPGPGWTLGGTI
jgi:hypothetical protein